MSDVVDGVVAGEYRYGFVDLDSEVVPVGLDESVVRLIAAKHDEPDWLVQWRLGALAYFLTLEPPTWPRLRIEPVDFQAISYWAAPKATGPAPESLDDIDPKLREMFDKLGISVGEQERLSGVAIDAIVDSVSVATTFRERLAESGVIFCPLLRRGPRPPRSRTSLPGFGGRAS